MYACINHIAQPTVRDSRSTMLTAYCTGMHGHVLAACMLMRADAQVQCVREVLLQMASMYTDLVMRADLPASKRGVQV